LSVPRKSLIYALLAGTAAAVFIASLLVGSVSLSIGEVWHALTSTSGGPGVQTLVTDLRLPRALTAFATGGVLALAGALMQVLLRNPLADPYVMGVSGGAAVAALLAILAGFGAALIDLAAVGGAFTTTMIVFVVARGAGGWTAERLLLTGIVVAAGANAAITMLLALSDDARLRTMIFWLMGDLSYATSAVPLLVLCVIAAALAFPFGRYLNVLVRGELQARVLGVPVSTLRIVIFLASSVLTAAAVTTAGTIGFVGLITPHLARLLLGSDHRRVLPAAALMGGTLLMAADLCARTLIAPRQLPVGAVTALVGIPVFLLLAQRRRYSPAT
jgi:iron complex transport system permease protein